MKRRSVLRRSMLFAIGMALGKLDALKASDGPHGQLTVPMDQWQTVVFKYRGREVRVPVSDIFEALSHD